MPFYQKKNFLEESLNSVLNQSYDNLEIILTNDEENIETKKFLEKISNKDSRIRLINNNRNVGAGESRNRAIDVSKGELIAFCDCDDLWKSTKLETQLEYMKKFKLDFSFTAYEIINEQGEVIGFRNAKKQIKFNNLIKSCDIGLSTVIMDKKIFLNKELRFANLKTKEDFVLWLKISKSGVNLYGLNEKLSSWRKSPQSLSSSSIQKLIDGYRVYRIHLNYSIFKSFIYLLILSLNFILKR